MQIGKSVNGEGRGGLDNWEDEEFPIHQTIGGPMLCKEISQMKENPFSA